MSKIAVIFQNSFGIQTFNFQTREILSTLMLDTVTPITICGDSRYFAYIDGTEVKITEVQTGEVHRTLPYCQVG